MYIEKTSQVYLPQDDKFDPNRDIPKQGKKTITGSPLVTNVRLTNDSYLQTEVDKRKWEELYP